MRAQRCGATALTRLPGLGQIQRAVFQRAGGRDPHRQSLDLRLEGVSLSEVWPNRKYPQRLGINAKPTDAKSERGLKRFGR